MTVPSSRFQVLIWGYGCAPALIAVLAACRQLVSIDTEKRAQDWLAACEIADSMGIKLVSWDKFIGVDSINELELEIEFHELA